MARREEPQSNLCGSFFFKLSIRFLRHPAREQAMAEFKAQAMIAKL